MLGCVKGKYMLYDYTGDWMSCVNDVVCRPSL